MKKKTSRDVIFIFKNFQEQVLNKKPPVEKIYEEVRMMKFKVRPIQGDVSLLNVRDKKFVEILWSLGKLDDLFQKEIDKIDPQQRSVFFRLFDDLYRQLQTQLGRLSLRSEKLIKPPVLEMEIFKEGTFAKKRN